MDTACEQVAELLPWFLNGTLEEEEKQQVERHLEECSSCRRELQEASFALEMFGDHLSSDQLAAYVFDDSLEGAERVEIERHLAGCQSCTEEVELARTSHQELTEEPATGEVIPFSPPQTTQASFERPPQVSPLWKYTALAAGLMGLILGTNSYLQKEHVTELELQLAKLEAPELNVLIFDVFPGELNPRIGGPDEATELPMTSEARQVTLILASQARAEYSSYEVDLVDGQDQIIWTGAGLRRHSSGDFTISFPTALLPAGNSSLRLYGRQGEERIAIERYPIRLP